MVNEDGYHVESAGQRPLSFLGGELFGRHNESNKLIEVYERRITSRELELALLTGASGTGKTRLAQHLRVHLEQKGGMLITGKFDQLQSPRPFSAFVAAFTDFSHQLLLKGEAAVSWVRRRVVESQNIDTQLLICMIPALATILEASPTDRPPQESSPMPHLSDVQQKKCFRVFAQFLTAICSSEYPCVLFLDDLQWADAGSLALLKTIVIQSFQGTMVLGACRGNEVQINDPLAEMLRSLEDDSGVMIIDIALTNLSKESINELVATSLAIDGTTCEPLSDVVFQLTNGNIFYTKQYLQSLHAEGIIFFDETSQGHWTWDDYRLQKSAVTTKEILAKSLRDLTPMYQYLLKISSSLGAVSDVDTLCLFAPRDVVETGIRHAITKGILNWVAGTCENDVFQFAHDQIQRAAYDLIPKDKKKESHLMIARTLMEKLTEEEIGTNLYMVVGQFAFGYELVVDSEERQAVATLCFRAGQQAISGSAFNTASSYLMLGINILGERCWRDNYDLCLSLHDAATEVCYCNAEIAEMEVYMEDTLKHARTYHDKVTAFSTKILSLGASMKLQEALHVGLDVLAKLGERLPSPTKYNILLEYVKTKWLLRGKSNNDILGLSLMRDEEKIGSMRIINAVFPYAFFCGPEYVPLLATTAVQLTLKYGLCALSAPGFAAYAILLCSGLGSKAQGYQSAQLALHILEKFDGVEWIPRVHTLVYGLVMFWRDPVQGCIQPLYDAYRIGLGTGDVDFALLAGALSTFCSVYSGRLLPTLVEEMKLLREKMLTLKQTAALALLTPTLQMCSNFLGQSDDPLVLTGEFMHRKEELHSIRQSKNKTAECSFFLCHAWLAVYMGDLERAEVYCARTRNSVQSSLARVNQHFLDGMAAAMAARATGVRKDRLRTVRQSIQQLHTLALAAPCNFLHSEFLLEAEIAGWKGNLVDAKFKYQKSIDLAVEGKYFHQLGLAYERLGYTLREHGEETEALQYYIKSREAFEDWGAKIKVDQLNRMISEFSLLPSLRTRRVPSSPVLVSTEDYMHYR